MRPVCRLIGDNAGAAAVTARGADGAQSVVSGSRSYWFFGDTVRDGPDGRADVVHAAVATTHDMIGADCVDLTFKATDGVAQPLLPLGDETTVWPDGVLAMDDGSILFYMVKAYRTSPFAWHVGAVGLGRVRPGSTNGERLVETIWDETTFGARVSGVRSPVRYGDDVIAYVRTDAGNTYVARAPLARIGERDAYAYWTGDGWSPEPARAAPIWEPPADRYVPADNGVTVWRDDSSGRWIAMYNADLASVAVRTAPEPWGPWSQPVAWFDCRPLVRDAYPYCYSSERHAQLSREGGRVQYITFSGQDPYDVTLVELHMASPVHRWRHGDAVAYAIERPGPSFDDEGVAFYASAAPALGMTPVYAPAYTAAPPEPGASPAFYAYPAAETGAIVTQPVYHGDGTALSVGDGAGEPLFHVPCVRASTNSSCAP
jgi:hypothetical protein